MMKLIEKIKSENREIIFPDDYIEFANGPEFDEVKKELTDESGEKCLNIDHYTDYCEHESIDAIDAFMLFRDFLSKYRFDELVIKDFDVLEDKGLFASLSVSKITVEGSAKRIPDRAFSNMTSLKEINLQEGLESIGDETFFGCRFLKKIVIPSSVTQIGKNICGNCIFLESIEVDDGNKCFGSFDSNVIASKDSMEIIQGCYKIVFHANFKSIDFRAFCKMPMLKEIILPESLLRIEEEAFFDCISLNKVHLPNSLKAIGKSSFTNAKPKEVSFNGTKQEYLAIEGGKVLDNVSCLDGVLNQPY